MVSDLPAFRHELRAMLEGPTTEIETAPTGQEALRRVAEGGIDLCVLDLQISNMGAMAICLELRHEESYGALPHVPVLMVLDRRPDVFLARRSGAEGFVLKPLDPRKVRRAVRELLAGGEYEDDSRTPTTVPASATE